MSLLMDALKRAEKARQAEAAKQTEGGDTSSEPQELSLVDPMEESSPGSPQPSTAAEPPPPPPPSPDKSTELQFSLEDTNTSMVSSDSDASDTGKELGPFSLVEDEELSREDTGEMAPIARDAEKSVNEYFDDASSLRISLEDVQAGISEETVAGTQPVSTEEMARQAAHTVFDAKSPSAKRRGGRAVLVAVPLFLILFLAVSGFFLWDDIVGVFVGPPPIVSRQPPPPSVPPETETPPAAATAEVPPPAEPVAGASPESSAAAPPQTAETTGADSEAEKLAAQLVAATSGEPAEVSGETTTETAPAKAAPPAPEAGRPPAEPSAAPEPSAEEIAALTRQALGAAPAAGSLSQVPTLKISRRLVPDQTQQALAQAYEAFQQGQNSRALALYENVLVQEPRNRNAMLGIAAVALRSGDTGAASRTYAKLLSLNPRDPVARAALIDLQQNVSPTEGEGHIRQLLSYHPDQAFLYASLGNLLARQARWPEAQFAYFEAYRLDNDNPDYAFNLAVGLDQIGQTGAALDYYRRALDLAEEGQASFEVQSVLKRISILSVPQGG